MEIKKVILTKEEISVERAIAILARNGIQVNDGEVAVILDLLYLMSKNYNKPKDKASKP